MNQVCTGCKKEFEDFRNFCSNCGMKMRASSHEPDNQRSKGPGVGTVGLIFGGLLVLILIGYVGTSSSGGTSSAPQSAVAKNTSTSIATPCVKDSSDFYTVYSAIGRGDIPALSGMADRGKFITLEKGTAVQRSSVREGKSIFVFVDSGYHVGESCWVADGLLN
jgi:hypothetical protein